ncbi:hypothetical protein GCM10011576_42950 [Micromonospora parathelypteridis]|nr:hypothetical protein GCM10011576_42950 [Micromonospora parathelypteridis]
MKAAWRDPCGRTTRKGSACRPPEARPPFTRLASPVMVVVDPLNRRTMLSFLPLDRDPSVEGWPERTALA